MSRVNWTQIGVFAVVVLLVFLIGASLLGSFGGYGNAPGMMGSRAGMMGPGMMGGWGIGPFGWAGVLFMWIVPLGSVALLSLGIVWLFRQVSGPSGPVAGPPPSSAGGTCSNCGRPTQADWQLCPYCGQAPT